MENKLNWIHVMDRHPLDGESIIQIFPSYEGHPTMGMIKFSLLCGWEKYLQFHTDNNLPEPDFWWIPAKDFPFPD